jgi:D-alanine-D-alanine ligase
LDKKNICILFGGVSSEHDVSIMSVRTVLDNIDKDKYDIITIGITKGGEWYLFEGTLPYENWQEEAPCKAIISPDRGHKCILKFTDSGVEEIKIDAVYPVLHGKNGEDGTIQGLCAVAGIPCIGSGVIGSAVCMDKCIAKVLFKNAGIPVTDWVEYRKGDKINYEEIEEKLGYPCFIKPPNAGSSVGVTKAYNRKELEDGIKLALTHDYKVMIEEAINPREIECSVRGNYSPEIADFPGEIKPAKDFYDFDAKYADENSALMIPAPIEDEIRDKIKEYAIKAYKVSECRGFSRVDFFLSRDDGKIYLNEINTLPGFTSISMYPKLWANQGFSIKEIISKHIDLAFELGVE